MEEPFEVPNDFDRMGADESDATPCSNQTDCTQVLSMGAQ